MSRPSFRRSPLARAATAALLATLVAACDDSTGPDGGPTAVQSAQVGAVLQDEVETDVGAVMIEAAVTPVFVKGDVGADLFANAVSPCTAPSNTTDTDGDGIYDDATITYTAPACTRTNRRGGTVTLTGALRIQDPTPNAAGLAFNHTLTDLTFSFTGGGVAARTYTVSRTGTRNVAVSGSGASLASDLTITRTFNAGDPATVVKSWDVTYTPAAGSSIVVGQPLPSGTLSATGSVQWTRGSEAFSLTVTTPTPLVHDATCDAAQRFTAGELRAQGTFNGKNGYLRIRWNGCGVEPSVVFIAI